MIEWLSKADPLAVWGAVLSTFLAAREIYKARTRIEIGYNFTGLPEEGNEITIRNLSSSPIIIKYWELVWCKRKFLKWVPFKSVDPGEFNKDIHVPEHSSTSLLFAEEEYFDWSHKSLKGGKIFIRLHLAGKTKPAFLKVYG
jgi:hypothetical protein